MMIYRLYKLCRVLSRVISFWPVIVISAFFAFTTGPHLRVNDLYDRPAYGKCLYLGSRGIIQHSGWPAHRCPWVMIFDSSKHEGLYE